MKKLLNAAKNNDQKAKQEVLVILTPLINSLLLPKVKKRDLIEDAKQEIQLGLLIAIEKFDLSKSKKTKAEFSQYAIRCCKTTVYRMLKKQKYTLSASYDTIEKTLKLEKQIEFIAQENGIDKDKIISLMLTGKRELDLINNVQVNKEEPILIGSIKGRIQDKETKQFEMIKKIAKEFIKKDQDKVLILTFLGYTQAEIAKILKVKHQRIVNIKREIINDYFSDNIVNMKKLKAKIKIKKIISEGV